MRPREDEVAGSQPADDAGRAQRIEALRSLSHDQGTASDAATPSRPSASAPSLRPPKRSPGLSRGWLAAISGLCALLVIAVGILALLQSHTHSSVSPPPPIPGTLTLALDQNHLTCPAQAAWAPDGLTIAVELTHQGCLANPGTPDTLQVALFNGRTGALVRLIDVRRDLPAWTPGAAPSLIWSPDSKQIALDATATDAQGQIVPALLVIPANGANTRYLQGSPLSTSPSALIWDLKSGNVAAVSPPLQPALSYQWTGDGRLVAAQPMPQATAGGLSTSTPAPRAAAASIPFWGSGSIIPLEAFDSTGSGTPFLPPAGYAFVSDLRNWSPDGRYLALPFPLAARLARMPGVSASPLSPRSCSAPLLQPACTGAAVPLPDSALPAVVRIAATPQIIVSGSKQIAQYNENPFPVAWRPTGGTLATILPGDGVTANAQSIVRVSLFSTLTGQRVADLDVAHAQPASEAQEVIAPALAWSPSGGQLALVDYSDNQVVVWGASRLPA